MDTRVRECETCYELFDIDIEDSCATTCEFCQRREQLWMLQRERNEDAYWRNIDSKFNEAWGK